MIKGWKLSPAWREYYEARARNSAQRKIEAMRLAHEAWREQIGMRAQMFRDQEEILARTQAEEKRKLLDRLARMRAEGNLI